MTGFDPVLKDNVQKITLYDIPSTWAQLKLLQHLEKWDHVIAFKTKRQKKYFMERERFQAVVKDLPETITTSLLYSSDPSQSPISIWDAKLLRWFRRKVPVSSSRITKIGQI
ncbi:uncharacterized protein OCT59_006494 [Rhizophagus irregularis]|uniref:uncharacterized protein n=1 Tax=Rhizophagus irregularis TaxID=588596 RepID=UPI00331A1BEC|nr:hypothetical protein OCT59_006494 [Rhizophagus irregularis]